MADAAVVRLSMSLQFTDITDLIGRLTDADAAPPTQSGDIKKNEIDDRPPEPSGRKLSGITHDAAGGPRCVTETESATPDPAPPRLSSAELERAANDERVKHIQEAVDGKLVAVLPARAANVSDPTGLRSNGND